MRTRLGRVKDEVQLADALEAAVQRLHKHCRKGQPDRQPATQGRTLNEVQDAQLTLGLVAEDDEVQCRKMAVDELRVLRNASARRRSRDTGRWAYLAEGGLVLYEAAQVVGCARGYALLR